ncbi:MAG: hypothetical protein ABI883_00690 [Chthoniobacterales bacterium]
MVIWALILFSGAKAQACACCSDPGEYRLEPNKPVGDYERAQLEGMKFAPAARLYLTDAGREEVKGLGSVSPENTVSAVLEPKRWRLTFRTEDGQTGVLTLPLPPKMTAFAVDIHDEEPEQARRLYKEWRFEGVPARDGIFNLGFAAPVRYTLIFQGRGNRCDNGEDFTHWRLEISGKKVSYAFFGELVGAAQ